MSTGLLLFTLLHVAISLVGIATGLVVLRGMIRGQGLDRWNAWFLGSTAATSLTGFLFPFRGFTPAIATGIISVVVLAIAGHALYRRRLAGAWRWVYAVTAVMALYLNVFVLVVQLFLKVPALHALAPNQNEPAFVAAQGLVLVLFVVLGAAAAVRFRGRMV